MTPQFPEETSLLSFKSLQFIVAARDAALSNAEVSWSPEERKDRFAKVPEINFSHKH